MAYISSPIKKLIVEAKEEGRTDRDVAKQFHVGQKSVSRIYQRWKAEKTVKRRLKSGRPRKLTSHEERLLVRYVKDDPRRTSIDVKKMASEEMGKEISATTAKRLLRDKNLWGRRPSQKPLTSVKNRKARFAYAKKYRNIEPDEWHHVLWSDWTKINLVGSDGIRFVRRPPGMRNYHRYMNWTVKHGGGSIMVWGKLVSLGSLH